MNFLGRKLSWQAQMFYDEIAICHRAMKLSYYTESFMSTYTVCIRRWSEMEANRGVVFIKATQAGAFVNFLQQASIIELFGITTLPK